MTIMLALHCTLDYVSPHSILKSSLEVGTIICPTFYTTKLRLRKVMRLDQGQRAYNIFPEFNLGSLNPQPTHFITNYVLSHIMLAIKIT